MSMDSDKKGDNVVRISPVLNEEVPAWDVALEALFREEHLKRGRPLEVGDFLHLSRQYVIRFDDIMYTLFELILNDKWQYLDEQGEAVVITRDQVERLRGDGRIELADVSGFLGGWQPRG